MTEAVEGIFRYAVQELGANRVEIRCDTRNERSAKVAERLGFTKEGVLRSDSTGVDGTLRSTNVYAKVRGIEYT
jgi:RimJ/RimL family protein N-acetyltransferase